MNTRYGSENAYITHQTLMMGLAAGGGIGDIPSMSQSYRRAVTKNPPKGEYLLLVLPPQKQGSNWHYGGRVVAAPGNSSPKSPTSSDRDFREFTIWRKWEDCLDLQKTVEREFSYFSSQRRKQQIGPGRPSSPNGGPGSEFYLQNAQRAASFDSLPSGPEPLSMALDVHSLLPKLSKKTALFGRPNQQLLTQRAEDFKTFIDALFGIHTPVMEDVRQSRDIRDWFGYWKRDKEGAKKASGQQTLESLQAPPSPAFSNPSPAVFRGDLPPSSQPATQPAQERTESQGSSLTIPQANPPAENRSSSATSASSDGSSSSLGLAGNEASASDDDEEELMDTFPPTPSAGPQQSHFTPIIRTTGDSSGSSHSSHRSPDVIQPSNLAFANQNNNTPPNMTMPPIYRTKPPTPVGAPTNSYVGYSVGGMMAPVPLFKSKTPNPPRPSTAPQRARPAPTTPTAQTFAAPAVVLPPPAPVLPPIARPPRSNQRPATSNSAISGSSPGTFGSAAANRQGRVFMQPEDIPRRPQSANSNSGNRGLGDPTPTPAFNGQDGLALLRVHGIHVERERSMSATETTSHAKLPSPGPSYSRPRAKTLANDPNRPDSPTLEPPPALGPTHTFNGARAVDMHDQHLVANAMMRKYHHGRKTSAASSFADTASFLEIALPSWSTPSTTPAPSIATEEASTRTRTPLQKEGRRSRGVRRSISSIESYLSDSSIDAALSTVRIGSATPRQRDAAPAATVTRPPAPLRRSMSTGASGSTRGDRSVPSSPLVSRVPEEGAEALWDRDHRRQSAQRLRVQHIMDEDEDVVDSYFYNSRSGPATPTTASSFNQSFNPSPRRPTTTAASEDMFSLKVLFPSFSDCAAIALRLPRSTSFQQLQIRLHVKFHEAEGIDLSQFAKGFRLGFKPPPSGLIRRASITGPVVNGRARSMSAGSSTMVDPSLLFVLKNDDDWRSIIPGPREKITIQVIIDH